MPELIDRQAVRLLESDADAYTENWNDGYEKGFCDAINKVLELPTIESEPVRRGRWIEETESDENGNVTAMCNQCYHTDEHCKNIKPPYCWYCGARMDATDTNVGGKGDVENGNG
jgi:hypothetical protein